MVLNLFRAAIPAPAPAASLPVPPPPVPPPPVPPPPVQSDNEEFMQVEIIARASPAADPVTAPAAATPAAPSAPCVVTTTLEKSALAYDQATKLLAMASIVAPEAPSDESGKRPPLDLIAVVDRSGSMSGQKIELMRQTLELLVTRAGLGGDDRFGLVSFDHAVAEEIALVPMDAAGRSRAKDIISHLRPGGATNLSGGLLKGCDMLSQVGGGEGRTRAIMLFTDGLANNGITETTPLITALQGAFASAATTASCHTFGFGAQHNETMLQAVAESTGGQYYYISGVEAIPDAFADCLGGLVSVVAQNAQLKLEAAAPMDAQQPGGCTIDKVLGAYKTGAGASPAAHTIELGDLYAQDSKDVLVELGLPALPAEVLSAPVLRATVRYFSVANSRIEEAASILLMARPAQTPAEQPCNLKLDEQRNRMKVAEAMEAAATLADAGRLAEGRQLLAACQEAVRGSPSAACDLSAGLVREVQGLSDHYEDAARYRSVGSKMSKMSAMSHQMQRSNHASAQMYSAGMKSKSAMKSAWMGM